MVAARDFAISGTEALEASLQQLLGQGAAGLAQQVRAFATVLAAGLGDDDLKAAHQAVGEAAQRSVSRSYGQLVTARQGPSGYRAGAIDNHSRRFAGGALRRALNHPDFFRATSRGIQFVNTRVLDQEAAHWYRLNFGAGGAGLGTTARFEVRWGSLVVASLGFDAAPSAAFVIPKGVWVSPTGERVNAGANPPGTDTFYPQGERPPGIKGRATKARITAGIEARNFLDAGLRRIANELPLAYDDVYRDWFNQAHRRMPGGPLTQVNVVAPRPRTLATRARRVPGFDFGD